MVINMNIRTAELRDLQALTDIYNYEILNGTATFDLAAVTPEERRPWFDSHNRDNHPLIVADDENGVIHGYASLSPYSQKKAYDPSVELSVYIAPDSRRMGIGTMLMKEILDIASKDGITHTVISLITSENSAFSMMSRSISTLTVSASSFSPRFIARILCGGSFDIGSEKSLYCSYVAFSFVIFEVSLP